MCTALSCTFHIGEVGIDSFSIHYAELKCILVNSPAVSKTGL